MVSTNCSQKVIVQPLIHVCTQRGDHFYKDMSGRALSGQIG